MDIIDYKAVSKDHTSRYGDLFEDGKNYNINSRIKFGSNGYHFCKRLKDTLRYFDGFSDIAFAKVIDFPVAASEFYKMDGTYYMTVLIDLQNHPSI